jgi:hypothetical protein
MKRKHESTSKIVPWANSSFRLKTRWEDWGMDKHFWAYLERRVPGRFGRLQVMHAIVPASRRHADPLFGSARYRKTIVDGARAVFRQAGVPETQVKDFMEMIASEYPYPNEEEIFVEQISSPPFATLLGERHKDLSYYQSGVPRFTIQDVQLIRDSLRDWHRRIKASRRNVSSS